MAQLISMPSVMAALALVAISGGESWRFWSSQGLAFALVLAVCIGQGVMMLVAGPRNAVR